MLPEPAAELLRTILDDLASDRHGPLVPLVIALGLVGVVVGQLRRG